MITNYGGDSKQLVPFFNNLDLFLLLCVQLFEVNIYLSAVLKTTHGFTYFCELLMDI